MFDEWLTQETGGKSKILKIQQSELVVQVSRYNVYGKCPRNHNNYRKYLAITEKMQRLAEIQAVFLAYHNVYRYNLPKYTTFIGKMVGGLL
jgi:hypothetical protein